MRSGFGTCAATRYGKVAFFDRLKCASKMVKMLTKSDFSKPQVMSGAGWSSKSKKPRTSSCTWAVTRQIGSSYEHRARIQGGLCSKRTGWCNVSWAKVFIAVLSGHTKQFSKKKKKTGSTGMLVALWDWTCFELHANASVLIWQWQYYHAKKGWYFSGSTSRLNF